MTTTVASPPTLAEAERNIAEAEKIAALWREIADVLRRTNGHGKLAAVSDDVPLPRGREAVRRIVAERPGMWSLAELREEMKRRGWFSSAKGLDVAVTRLCVTGEARRVDKGRYQFPPATEVGGSP
jgi:hypothetical protein